MNSSSNNFILTINKKDCLEAFQFRKFPCGQSIPNNQKFITRCVGQKLENIISTPFPALIKDLKIEDPQEEFYLYIEWDALRTILAQYLGVEDEAIDKDRCCINSIQQKEEGTCIEGFLLPPKDL